MKIVLLVLCLSALAGLASGQSAEAAPTPLATAIWGYLEEPSNAAARKQLTALRARADLDPEALEKILDAPRPAPLPQAGVFERRPFTIPGVSKETTYTLRIPQGLESGQRYPLWISIHGTGGTEKWAFHDLDRHLRGEKVFLVAPTEASDIHGQGWGFRHRERMLHVGLLEQLARRLPVDRNRVVVAGISRGGHGAFDLAMRYSDRIAASMPVIGAVPQRDLPLVVNLHDIRLHAMNGEQDQAELVRGAKEARARIEGLGYPATFLMDPARGHGSFGDQYPTILPELSKARRDPAPAKLHFAVRDLEYGRHYYVWIRGLHKSKYTPGKSIRIPGVGKMSAERKRVAYVEYIEQHTPWVKVRIEDNVVTVTGKLVTRLDLYLPASRIDVTRPVDVLVNGRRRISRRKLKHPSPARTLELMREFAGPDPAFRFLAKIPLTIR